MELIHKKDSVHLMCQNCQQTIFMQAVATSYCQECGRPIASEHRPAYKLCRSCAEKQHRCAQCGKPLL